MTKKMKSAGKFENVMATLMKCSKTVIQNVMITKDSESQVKMFKM